MTHKIKSQEISSVSFDRLCQEVVNDAKSHDNRDINNLNAFRL